MNMNSNSSTNPFSKNLLVNYSLNSFFLNFFDVKQRLLYVWTKLLFSLFLQDN